ncbi:homoserine dehydrogenase [Salisediminibacterium halotolerans]|uniref:Homoserine dehydrogenase n=1 Tax=Salisediminibacterium halotolerans TaxID=517425 RepID=A0A1H9W7R4_9BACI|nr:MULTISPECIES: homoserine dehydrogenase [Salisediminibacterium]RLJ69680.1 homoserine dehydrogenase [Actinophytocola xinjiangensis]RPE89738.1 homoserine dehydrogenase [Salisediminibacterium halotolerans]TWG32574.1 homoserine dehydrogenase [Salisediminibacterium halotolerans]SES30006.1 homoserine dehydrogenase [Salisediminibacterium haloalkalitolerans]GEL08073.1 homoserine dehydrogenase [Salisediminibacterium halotolerans]
MQQAMNIGLLGFGTVGSGVLQIIQEHQDKLYHQIGCGVTVKKILVNDLEKERPGSYTQEQLTTDADEILKDPEIDAVVEVMGGMEEARLYIRQALENGKNVVTANKDVMAEYGSELLDVADANSCDLYYEASVAGGIPILRTLVEGLASDRITKMMGIVNGTTNYILTKMTKEGRLYEEVLKEAQALGYAEADPSSDVDGLDAARKISILGTLGFSMNLDLSDVKMTGIRNVTSEDIQYAKQLGYTMKLIGLASRDNDEVEVSVEPALVPSDHPLASVDDEFNAVYVYGEAVGETMFYGPGAGKLPTATAIVSDLVNVLKNKRLGVSGNSLVLPQFDKKLKADENIDTKYLMRIHAKDLPGTFASLTALFSQHGVSLEKILQVPLNEGKLAEIIVVTHSVSRKTYDDVLEKLNEADEIVEVKSSYRVEGEIK